MGTEMAVYFLIAIALLFLLGKLMAGSLKFLLKALINAVLGIVLLVITNTLGASFGIGIGINIITILVAGFLGVPGVLFLLVFKYLL
jgi:inhibitor of the pro-sigma K processing machinery